jgi:hypothetical protein
MVNSSLLYCTTRIAVSILARRIPRPSRQPASRAAIADLDRRCRRARVHASAPRGNAADVPPGGNREGNEQHIASYLQAPSFSSSSDNVKLKPPLLTAWRRSLVVRRPHLTMGRSACRAPSRPPQVGKSARRQTRATLRRAFSPEAARRYGARVYFYCDDRRRPSRRVLARGARASRVYRRQVWQWKIDPALQPRYVRHIGGKRGPQSSIRTAIDDAIGMPGAVRELPVTPQRLKRLLDKRD